MNVATTYAQREITVERELTNVLFVKSQFNVALPEKSDNFLGYITTQLELLE